MQESNSINNLENKRSIWLFTVIIMAIAGFAALIFAVFEKQNNTTWPLSDFATFIAGTTGTAWSGAGIILIYVVYLGQKIEIMQQREELVLTREQLESQAKSMQGQIQISLAAQDYQISKNLIDEFCAFLNSSLGQFTCKEALKGMLTDTDLYVRKTGSHENKYNEFLLQITASEVKRAVTTRTKFLLASIAYKIEKGNLAKQEKAILINQMFQTFGECYHVSIPMLLNTFDISNSQGKHPKFHHVDFVDIEAAVRLMNKFDKYYNQFVIAIFEDITNEMKVIQIK